MASRVDNAIRNMSFGALNRITSVIFPFIVRTVFIKTLGEEYLGLNSLFSSVLQVLNLADLGFASAIVASMYKPIAQGDTNRVCALLNLYKSIYRKIGLLILSVGVVLTPFIHHFINGEPPAGINIYLYWNIYLFNTVISYLFYAYEVSFLNAIQRNDIVELVGATTRILTSVVQIILVVVYNSFIMYVVMNTVCTIMYNYICHIVVKKKYPTYICRGIIDKESKKKIYNNVMALAIQKIGNTVSLSLDSIIISAFLGLTTVAIYGNYFYIISAITTFVMLLYTSSTAGIGNSIAIESIEKNYSDFKKFTIGNIWIAGWCSICFMCLFQDFMRVWMGEKLLFTIPVVLMLVLRFYVVQIRRVLLTYKDAAGMWIYDKWRPLVACEVNFFLNLYFVNRWGVFGIAFATIISYLCVEIPWETKVFFKHYFNKKSTEYYIILVTQTIKILIVGATTFTLCLIIPVSGILAIVVKLLVCIFVPNILFFVINYGNKEFYAAYIYFSNILKKIFKRLGLE